MILRLPSVLLTRKNLVNIRDLVFRYHSYFPFFAVYFNSDWLNLVFIQFFRIGRASGSIPSLCGFVSILIFWVSVFKYHQRWFCIFHPRGLINSTFVSSLLTVTYWFIRHELYSQFIFFFQTLHSDKRIHMQTYTHKHVHTPITQTHTHTHNTHP